jgi:hypothetical protein
MQILNDMAYQGGHQNDIMHCIVEVVSFALYMTWPSWKQTKENPLLGLALVSMHVKSL